MKIYSGILTFSTSKGNENGLKNRVVREIGGKISVRLRNGKDFWLKLSGGSN